VAFVVNYETQSAAKHQVYTFEWRIKAALNDAPNVMADLHPAEQAFEAERHWRGAVRRVAPQAAIEHGIVHWILAVIHLKNYAMH
jgi:hypothetical protein